MKGIFDELWNANGNFGTFTNAGTTSAITYDDIKKVRDMVAKMPKPLTDVNVMVNEYLPKGTIMVAKDVYERFEDYMEKK
jgi:hypothetical protein